MCGFAGFVTSRLLCRDQMVRTAAAMAATLRHRGPDDSGEWADPAAGVALGFRRLSIIDLSPAGHQPMHSRSGRYTIVFNGEVYNFAELRQQIAGADPEVRFRGHSDTEVVLECIERWGLESSLRRFIGMFAFALWDAKETKLHLVRDRLGVKPLHYGTIGGTLVFASELKAFDAYEGFEPELSPDAVDLLMRFGYVPAPLTIDRGIFKLPPGSMATFRAGEELKVSAYWSLRETVDRAAASRFRGTAEEAMERLNELLCDSIRLRMVADVPVGVFLSGGIDSSTVATLAQHVSSGPVKTFTIGFRSAGFDEAPFARRIAQHLGTDHHEVYVSPAEALAVIPRLPLIYDEPFADSSQIPMCILASVARRTATVTLSGDGGDELFGGYTRYVAAPTIWRALGWVPQRSRRHVGELLVRLSPATWHRLSRWRFLPPALRHDHMAEKVSKLSRALRSADGNAFYLSLASRATDGFLSPDFKRSSAGPSTEAACGSFAERMMYSDTLSYLPDDILVKVDRASMSAGLECREPLLDHRLLEFAWSLPLAMRVRRGRGKWILREVLRRHVPAALTERPKSGFSIPLAEWLRGPLRDWADALLHSSALRAEGVFDADVVRAAWSAHCAGKAELHEELWSVLMFRAWQEQRRQTRTAALRLAGVH